MVRIGVWQLTCDQSSSPRNPVHSIGLKLCKTFLRNGEISNGSLRLKLGVSDQAAYHLRARWCKKLKPLGKPKDKLTYTRLAGR